MDDLIVFARNFRGFPWLEIDLSKTNFIVGDNSSGKSSILHLINAVLSSNLNSVPKLDEELAVSRYDYFSPFFDMDDVTLGYQTVRKERIYSKIVTVKYSKKTNPIVSKCTIRSGGVAVSLKMHGRTLRKKTIENCENWTVSDLCQHHEMEEKFSNVKERKFPDVPPNSPIALLQAFDGDFIEQNDLLRPAVGIELPSVRHLTPVRGMPEKYYDFKTSFSVTGRHFAPMWQDLKAKNKEGIFKTINDFGIESGLFEDIDVARVSKKISDSPLIVTVKKGERDFFLNQVGVGVSQVVPVLVETIFSKYSSSEKMLLFQQPELHLHPVAQAALGSFFFSASASGANIVIESHSNILIDRFRADLRDASLDDKKKSPTAQILFCKNGDDGNSLQIIDINRDGKLVDPPEEYFKFFIDELSRTMF